MTDIFIIKSYDPVPPSSPGFAIMLAVLFPCESSKALSPKKSPFFRVLRNCSPPKPKSKENVRHSLHPIYGFI